LLAEVSNTGFGLMAELLSFASPKESKQRKGIFVPRFGLPPALLFFASPKKSNQKKGLHKRRLTKPRHREERSDAAIHKCSIRNAWFLSQVSA
jgi:hypothetical protein